MRCLYARSPVAAPTRAAQRAGLLQRVQPRRPSRRYIPTQAGISARWCIDIRYGVKMEAVQLMQEWVHAIGSQAGLTSANAAIRSGAVGVPESRLELEVEFDSFAELEDFWAAIPQADHREWSERMQKLVVHGSPTWEVYRTVPLLGEGGKQGQGRTRASAPGIAAPAGLSGGAKGRQRSAPVAGGSGLLVQPSSKEIQELAPPQQVPAAPPAGRTTESGLSIVSGDEEAQIVLDWKGDPMKINPGDKLPFKFL